MNLNKILKYMKYRPTYGVRIGFSIATRSYLLPTTQRGKFLSLSLSLSRSWNSRRINFAHSSKLKDRVRSYTKIKPSDSRKSRSKSGKYFSSRKGSWRKTSTALPSTSMTLSLTKIINITTTCAIMCKTGRENPARSETRSKEKEKEGKVDEEEKRKEREDSLTRAELPNAFI